MPASLRHLWKAAAALAALLAAAPSPAASAAPADKPVAGQQVRFPQGAWSALPQTGPDGQVRQCVLVALRQRTNANGKVDTRFALNISRGSGLVFTMMDDGLPTEQVLDDQAEIVIDGRSFPAVGFSVGTAFALHPGDADGALTALGKAKQVTLRSDGAGIDSGAVAINLPQDALGWLTQCGKTFDIAIDKPTDPNAPDMPTPRPRSPKIAVMQATPAGPPGIEDKQKIEGWDASELRNRDGAIMVCFIRRHYVIPGDGPPRRFGTFLMASRLKGFSMMVKDSKLDLPDGTTIEATLKVGGEPFPALSAQVLGHDEIGLFPQHGNALVAALEKRSVFELRASKVEDKYEFSVHGGVIGWLRACARRNGISIEPAGQ
ncbi:hypothetical protein JQ596_21535 [Bradyrhizobium manausense]|uniref:hypothetical protein n=1 Tax=Bradyrhizobium TaxID=374 RepID=UPI001BA8F6B8|nr:MULTISPECIES: hypothetical protein [Bradyrhizobium]MBR0828122.1 hypothetical protein [Bradyrhizobium manausense]UVO32978.1 hypothetical protein KUF59_21340 [Bradyrhizobium arachidis]